MTDTLTVKLHPVWVSGSRGYRYNVMINDEVIVSLSRDPETDLARALLEQSVKGVVTVLDGKTGQARTKVYIERAAKFRTVETGSTTRFRQETCADGPCAGESAIPGTGIHPNSLGAAYPPIEPSFPQKNYAAAETDGGQPQSEVA